MTDAIAKLSLNDEGDLVGTQDRPAAARSTKRVLIYGINYAPEPIGVGRYTGDIGAYLAQKGVDVEVVTAIPHYPGWLARSGYVNRYRVETQPGLRIWRCPLLLRDGMYGIWRMLAPLSFSMTSAPVVIWRIVCLRPDTVFCVEPTLFAAPVALLAAKLVGSRTILHVQDLEIDAAFAVGHLSNGLLRCAAAWFEQKILAGFDAVVTISESMRRRLLDKGLPAARVSVVRNWVDLDKIKPLGRPSIFRQELGIAEDKVVALYSGHIGPKQALPLMLDAAAKLVDESNILFVIAGEGPEKERLVARYGNLSNVQFIPLQSEERLCELLNLADVHVLPQMTGTADLVLPSKLGGMLASGKPCVVMADAGTEIHTFLGSAMQFVPAGDTVALTRALRETKAAVQVSQTGLHLAHQLQASDNLAALSALALRADNHVAPTSAEVHER